MLFFAFLQIKIELTKGQFQEIYDAVRDLPDEIREDLKLDGEEPDTAHLDLFSAVDELARIDKRLNKQFKQVKLNSPDWEWQLIMCHNLPRIGYKIPYNKNVTNIIPQMIKVGTNVKSKIHDDLTGHVVICEPIDNYAVIMTDIIDYEMMTVECFLSDLEVA